MPPSLRNIFRPSKSADPPPRSRNTLSRLRRTGSLTPLNQPDDVVSELPEAVNLSKAASVTEARAITEEIQSDNDSTQHGEHTGPGSRSAASSVSRPNRSKRFKEIMARFRRSKSHEPTDGSEEAQDTESPAPSELQVTGKEVGAEVTTTTDLAQRDPPLSHNPSPAEPTGNQQRNVSAQTAESHNSKETSLTTIRHPPMDIELPADWFATVLAQCSSETRHFAEASDPFSDSKTAEVSIAQVACASSKHSHSSRSSKGKRPAESVQENDAFEIAPPRSSKVPSARSSRQVSGHRTPSAATTGSVSSTRLDPNKAVEGFNYLAGQLNLPLSITAEETSNFESEETRGRATDVESNSRRRLRLTRRVRPVQSNLDLDTSSSFQTPVSKLRRTKTFANLTRRPSPMSTLKGKSLEHIARLGGHSYLVWGSGILPAPLQLPACIVAMAVYLRKYGANVNGLFVEPGDVKEVHRLYDYFASQVLDAEKEASHISMTLRTIAMPQWEGEADNAHTLSVGWTLRVILTGLPFGILGSPRLYRILKDIYLAALPNTQRVQLITLAIIALTSEMERALICAIFGLLTSLLQQMDEPALPEEPDPGTALRTVASLDKSGGFARVFGPMLLGVSRQDRGLADMTDEEREVADERVAQLLIDNWRSVNRQLRGWATVVKLE